MTSVSSQDGAKPFLHRIARAPFAEAVLCVAGIMVRAGWALLRPQDRAMGEAMNVAVALGEGRGFAGAYGAGHGATAHLLPAGPAFAGFVYTWWPPGSGPAETLLATWSIALAIGTYLFLYRAMGHLSVPRGPRLVALAVGMLAPVYMTLEAIDFRVWEGGLATFLAAMFLDRLLLLRRTASRDGTRPTTFPRMPVVIASILSFVHPPLGLAAFACLTVFGLTMVPFRACLAGAALAFTLVAVMIVPWTIRNYYMLHAFVPLRSNAGLELAIGNNPAMAASDDTMLTLDRTLHAIHPLSNDKARAEVLRIGEVAYSRRLGDQALAWITAHPSDAARLWVGHVRRMLFPDGWRHDANRYHSQMIRAWFLRIISAIGLFGLAMLFQRNGADAIYPAVMLSVPVLFLTPFQPAVRYVYIIYPLLCLMSSAMCLAWKPYRAANP